MSQFSLLPVIGLCLDVHGRPACLSTDVAQHFQKKRKHVLDNIHRIIAICPESFCGTNFRPVGYMDSKGEKRPAYQLTRDAFSLLAMGFTGSAALRWKLKYIEAFNAMETALGSEALAAARLVGSRAALADAALALLAEGCTQREAARLLNISRHTVYRLKMRFGFLASHDEQEALS